MMILSAVLELCGLAIERQDEHELQEPSRAFELVVIGLTIGVLILLSRGGLALN